MKIIWLDSIDSTNSEVLRNPESYANLTVVAAREQTAGRGQRGNTWFTEPGKNLTFSIVVKPGAGKLPSGGAFRLNILCPLVVRRFLVSNGIEAKVKWPNDIYALRRKICGILVENRLDGTSVGISVMGIGLNVNQTDFPEVSLATSMKLLSGRDFDLEDALEDISDVFSALYPAVFDDVAWAPLFDEYVEGLFGRDTAAQYVDVASGREFTGVIRSVEPGGRLVMSVGDEIRQYAFKEVSYIL